MLTDGEHVEADFFGLLRDLHDGVDALRLRRRLSGYRVPGDVADREDPELHCGPLRVRYMRLHVPERPGRAGYSRACGLRLVRRGAARQRGLMAATAGAVGPNYGSRQPTSVERGTGEGNSRNSFS